MCSWTPASVPGTAMPAACASEASAAAWDFGEQPGHKASRVPEWLAGLDGLQGTVCRLVQRRECLHFRAGRCRVPVGVVSGPAAQSCQH